jgi:ABC-2 type transport system permease protein
LFGFDEGIPISSAPGYLQLRLFASVATILMLIMAIAAGASAIGGSEEDGGLELLLSNPVTRARVFVARYLAMVAMLAANAALLFLAIVGTAPLFDALEGVSIPGLAVACAGCGLIALLHGTVAFAVGAWTGRRNVALAAASAVAVGGYVAQGVLSAANVPEALRFLSPWHWFLRDNMLAHGPNIASWLPALIASAVVAVSSWPRFRSRDLR